MAEKDRQEPRGLGEHSRGIASEKAHEQGWGLNQDERSKLPEGEQNTYGGNDYDHGARDFGDEPVNVGKVAPVEVGTARDEKDEESA